MKILFTGGGTGGHFYPIIAVAQELARLSEEEKFVAPQLYFMSNGPYNKRALFDNSIAYIFAPAGNQRIYFSPKNIWNLIKTFFGILGAIWKIYLLYPDVIFSKGGYSSIPALVAARVFGIPVVIHESDSVPGRVNLWAGKFAVKIAVSYPEAAKFFPPDKTAVTGNPIRRDFFSPAYSGAHEFFGFDPALPVIYVTGGSSGSAKMNDTLVDTLPQLIEHAQVIIQTGKDSYEDILKRVTYILEKTGKQSRCRVYDYVNTSALRMIGGSAAIVISRAGSTIFEIAAWGIPSIIIPGDESVFHNDHQRKNAYAYARTGACVVIEDKNLRPNILYSEIERILQSQEVQKNMREAAKAFADDKSAQRIARELLTIALSHEI
ncbi:MAG: UDP-N-acetylglucosamine--N-acetylmuramyl-(pentapeptide) pyrophosphoryl-undecaprenol N-acetylglucosamine transferase [Candidatus Paceibacterota bacterium]|jgi:UDP-N-acetylglucosamine--N-acetylmuramyl-(pentapeptide) pyrophosphoryl-undecaprenol N-acetylglucosamine transferase